MASLVLTSLASSMGVFFRDGPTDKAIFGRRMRDEEFEKPFDFFEIVPPFLQNCFVT